MSLAKTFWRTMAIWTAIIAGILIGITALTGGASELLASAPLWIGMAFLLAAYPAGIATVDHVLPDRTLSAASLATFTAVAASAAFAAFLLTNWVGPALQPSPASGLLADPSSMTLGELGEQLRVAGERARGGPDTAENWLPFNWLAWHFVRRTDGMLLPALFAGVGLLTGYWSRRIPRADLRRLVEWGIGAFLMISTYMAGENGYELILMRIGGPAEFVGDLVLIVPGTLIVGLGLATVADMLSDTRGARDV